MFRYVYSKKKAHKKCEPFITLKMNYTTPCPSIASATLTKPAILAPFT